jgi:hypothetical protein
LATVAIFKGVAVNSLIAPAHHNRFGSFIGTKLVVV